MLQALLDDPDWQAVHPAWPWTAEQQYWQTLRDLELVRPPMLFGSAGEPVRTTRNPARGFLPFRRELVVAMIEEGDAILGQPAAEECGGAHRISGRRPTATSSISTWAIKRRSNSWPVGLGKRLRTCFERRS